MGSDTIVATSTETLDFSGLNFGTGIDVDLNLRNSAQTVVDHLGQQLELTFEGSFSRALVENVIGTNQDDAITANSRANRLEGGLGSDTYLSSFVSSNDTIIELDGQGVDTLDYSSSFSNLTIDLREISEGVEDVVGGSGNDTIIGNSLNNRLEGGEGDDIYRFAGQDSFCLLYTSPSPRDLSTSRMPSSA